MPSRCCAPSAILAETLASAARAVLLTAEPLEKAAAATLLQARFRGGEIALRGGASLPERPARPERPLLLPPAAMPRRGRAGSPRARFALLHALAHIELNAIDLAIDTAGRFGPALPPAFAADWLKVAAEEAEHFRLLDALLRAAGGAYGDLPAHGGLWESAMLTSGDLLARLAVVPQVLEARGLDVTPPMIARFRAQGDAPAEAALSRILKDEIGHVETGNRWFRTLCVEASLDPKLTFHMLVERSFRGTLKPPFNDSARREAGLATDWYEPLVERENVNQTETVLSPHG